MIALAIDTSSSLCSACIYDSEQGIVLGKQSEDIGRGHAEHLMEIISTTMHQAGIDHARLDRVITSIGPGSFTGIRVGVATARGFGIALSVPVIGVSILENLICRTGIKDKPVGAIQLAGRGEAYCQFTIDCEFAAANTPFVAKLADIENSQILKAAALTLCGSGAEEVSKALNATLADIKAHCAIEFIAVEGCKASYDGTRPEPLYLRKPDAKVQQGFAVERSDQ